MKKKVQSHADYQSPAKSKIILGPIFRWKSALKKLDRLPTKDFKEKHFKNWHGRTRKNIDFFSCNNFRVLGFNVQ